MTKELVEGESMVCSLLVPLHFLARPVGAYVSAINLLTGRRQWMGQNLIWLLIYKFWAMKWPNKEVDDNAENTFWYIKSFFFRLSLLISNIIHNSEKILGSLSTFRFSD